MNKNRITLIRMTAFLTVMLLSFSILIGCSSAFPINTQVTTAAESCDLRVLFVKVGNADCTLISLNSKHYLIDTGTKDSFSDLKKADRKSVV